MLCWGLRGTNMVRSLDLFPQRNSDKNHKDNLQVQWGSQDHYEIVRKVGRGKYSEVTSLQRFVF
jgi:hypothetical protein